FVGGGGSTAFGFVMVLVICFGFFFVSLSGIGIAFTSGSTSSFGFDSVSPLDSLATIFCVSTCGFGRGIVLTRVALMASPPKLSPPQLLPELRPSTNPYTRMEAKRIPCSTSETASGELIPSRSVKMSVLAAIRTQRLCNDADVGDAARLHRVHHGREGAEGNIFVSAHEDVLVLWISNLLVQLVCDFINVDWIVAEEDALFFIDGNHQSLFGDLLHSLGLRNGDFYARLQHRRSDHEDDEQHQHDVHERSDIDVRQRGLRPAL